MTTDEKGEKVAEPIVNPEEEKVKVGDKEYTQEELSRVVGLGELGVELEEKWNTKIDRLYPEFTKATQEREELRTKVEEYEAKPIAPAATSLGELTEEDKVTARKQLTELLGGEPLTKEQAANLYQSQRAGESMLEETQKVVGEVKEKYGIETTVEDVLNYMSQPTNAKDPNKAVKDMFEPQIDTWKEQQFAKIKSNGIQTIEGSSAGGKQPEAPKLSDIDSLRGALKSHFSRT